MMLNKKLAFGSECLTSRHPRHNTIQEDTLLKTDKTLANYVTLCTSPHNTRTPHAQHKCTYIIIICLVIS